MNMEWTDGFRIFVSACRDREVTVSANREGLLSLAGQLKALAEGMPGIISIMMSITPWKKGRRS